ncbi:hypothetical protein [Lujinxingia litoralis]|uniref:hypothetical protein n=1 Tax=Lujinxingia litoralis TaxID=2211119 RepID=UPI0011B94A47|nr:hypothetical protein [Lujinxingia litoralis]
MQTHPSEPLSWRTPRSFEAIPADSQAVFEAHGRPGRAAVFRIPHAYPPSLAGEAVRLHWQKQGLAENDHRFTYEVDETAGEIWVIQELDFGQQRVALVVTDQDATWAVSLVASRHNDPDQTIRETLRSLVAGLSPTPQQVVHMSPDISLGQALAAPEQVELLQVDASGSPRPATTRELNAPTTLLEGFALAEPLPYALSLNDYLHSLAGRYITADPSLERSGEALPCGESCLQTQLHSRAWTVTLAAKLDQGQGRHLVIWHPRWFASAEHHTPLKRWVEDFALRGNEVVEAPSP